MKKKPLYTILLLALVLRVSLPLASYILTGTTSQFHSPDTPSYVDSAASLLETGNFSRWGIPEIERTPGYPSFLIPGLLSRHLNLVTICLQILISVFTVYMVYLTAVEIFADTRAALVSASLYLIEPLSIISAAQILTETLFTALIIIFAYLMARYFRDASWRTITLASVALAVTVYVRPAAYCLPLLTVVFIIFRAIWFRVNLRGAIRHALVFLTLYAVLIGTWQIRNYIQTGYSGFSSIGINSLYFYTVPQIMATKHGGNWADWRDKLGWGDKEAYFAKHPEQRNWELDETLKWKFRQAQRYILDNLIIFGKLYLVGAAYTILGPGSDQYYRLLGICHNPSAGAKQDTAKLQIPDVSFVGKIKVVLSRPLSFIIIQISFLIVLALTYLTAVYGTLATFKIRPYEICFVLLIVAYLIAVPGTVGYSRFRAPAMPLICVLSGYGLLQIFEKLKTRFLKGATGLAVLP